MPIPERVRKPDSVIREEEQRLIKAEHYPARRLRFLDHSVPDHSPNLIVKVIIIVLAVYGLYSLIF